MSRPFNNMDEATDTLTQDVVDNVMDMSLRFAALTAMLSTTAERIQREVSQ